MNKATILLCCISVASLIILNYARLGTSQEVAHQKNKQFHDGAQKASDNENTGGSNPLKDSREYKNDGCGDGPGDPGCTNDCNDIGTYSACEECARKRLEECIEGTQIGMGVTAGGALASCLATAITSGGISLVGCAIGLGIGLVIQAYNIVTGETNCEEKYERRVERCKEDCLNN